jgi:hypothetical protein
MNDSKQAARRRTLSIQEFLGERFAAEEVAWHLGVNMMTTMPAFAELARIALADLEAKRAVLKHMQRREARAQFTTSDLTVLCILAVPYAKHADYQPRWTP